MALSLRTKMSQLDVFFFVSTCLFLFFWSVMNSAVFAFACGIRQTVWGRIPPGFLGTPNGGNVCLVVFRVSHCSIQIHWCVMVTDSSQRGYDEFLPLGPVIVPLRLRDVVHRYAFYLARSFLVELSRALFLVAPCAGIIWA